MFKDQITQIQTFIDGQANELTVEMFKSWKQDFLLAIAHEEQIAIQNDQIASLQDELAVANAQLEIVNGKKWHEAYLIELNRTRIAEIFTLLESLHWIADASPAFTLEAAALQRDLFQSIAITAIETHPEEWAEWPQEVLTTIGKTIEEMPPPMEVKIGPMPAEFQAIANNIIAIETTPRW